MQSPTEFTTEIECAQRLDALDPLAGFRDEFNIPLAPDGSESIYLVGNSLGAAPLAAAELVAGEIDRWGLLGVHGHHEGESAWIGYHELLTAQLAEIVGGERHEVVAMNSLTVNLHLLMTSFYRPSHDRHKIIIEAHAFPSDHFAVESQIRQRGFSPSTSMIVVNPRPGEHTIRPDDVLACISEHADELALVMLPGVQYYTGQVFDMQGISRAAHEAGALVGFDLAHAVGNVVLSLHDWQVDFAAWCNYKYLNGGPGAVGGAFVHGRHVDDQSLDKLLGWWGAEKETRFEMSDAFVAIPTVESWQLSCPSVLSMAPLRASLETIGRAGGIEALRAKSEVQIGYLDFLLRSRLGDRIECITPKAIEDRGCQFSLQIVAPEVDGRLVFDRLEAAGVMCDWRYPDVIRVAPVPLYNSFVDIHRFVEILADLVA